MEKEIIKIYHTSSLELKSPDVNYGRKNADFGGGFYLSNNFEFSKKWANEQKSIVNEYTLDLTGLTVKRFSLDTEWFNYIFENRFESPDELFDTDVIIGPIANDTLYDTYGIITSGLLKNEESLKLLMVGKRYIQFNVKTKKAASHLKWEGSKQLSKAEIEESKKALRAEEQEFRKAFWEELKTLDKFSQIEEILS